MNLYERLNPQVGRPTQTGNPIIDMFGNFTNFQQQYNQFASQMRNTNPKETVQSLLSSGQMSQEQFNNLSQIANMIVGHKQF